MFSVIVALPKVEDAKKIKNILVKQGIEVALTCASGAQAVSKANELDAGIIICGYQLSDMHYSNLFQYLPNGFEMLLLASPSKLGGGIHSSIVCLSMPIKLHELVSTIEMMTYNHRRRKKKEKPKKRSEKENAMIEKAKTILMERNNLSEEDAHRYIQKTSMDSGTNILETAEMILSMM